MAEQRDLAGNVKAARLCLTLCELTEYNYDSTNVVVSAWEPDRANCFQSLRIDPFTNSGFLLKKGLLCAANAREIQLLSRHSCWNHKTSLTVRPSVLACCLLFEAEWWRWGTNICTLNCGGPSYVPWTITATVGFNALQVKPYRVKKSFKYFSVWREKRTLDTTVLLKQSIREKPFVFWFIKPVSFAIFLTSWIQLPLSV